MIITGLETFVALYTDEGIDGRYEQDATLTWGACRNARRHHPQR